MPTRLSALALAEQQHSAPSATETRHRSRCSKDRHAAFDRAIAGEQIEPASCKNPVRSMYEMGLNIGVNGTPAIYNADGIHIGAYMSAAELENALK